MPSTHCKAHWGDVIVFVCYINKIDFKELNSLTKMSRAGFVFGNLCDVFWMNTCYFFVLLCSTLPPVLWSCCLHVASWLWFWGWGVSVRDAGGSWVTEDEYPIVERGLRSRLGCMANITEDSPWLSFTFGFLFSKNVRVKQKNEKQIWTMFDFTEYTQFLLYTLGRYFKVPQGFHHLDSHTRLLLHNAV